MTAQLGSVQPQTGTVWRRYAVWTCLVLAILLLGAYGTGYDAQEFVYFQF